MKKLNEEQKSVIEVIKGKECQLTYAQQVILKRALLKLGTSSFQDCYGTDYNDCHGDYYDADYN